MAHALKLLIGQVGNIATDLPESHVLHNGIPSAIEKKIVTDPIFCSFNGLDNDEQADPKHHGGAERALHYYPNEHYEFWSVFWQGMGLGEPKTQFGSGAFGENLSGQGWQEETVCIGDIFQLGKATIQISQPRSPCFKLNHHFGYAGLSVLMQANGKTGWLLRVLEEGVIQPSDTLELIERPYPELSVRTCANTLFNKEFDHQALSKMVDCEALSVNWRQHAQNWLDSGVVNDWSRRLTGNFK
ncbi:MOSC domain-containing protein [Vibrio sp. Of7-15]|uniref:MOSC domain-containing protein n=1 Tax=Vibrio sp. Of7-15 TaxID=2724879 RepID=UPI001EF34ABF|nr:MOSC domain-containing protein [Vibrio sp. Of7-15]MCG7496688.1 MOSC domain-containing protein [Vibrio sp. Of7-15]